MITARWNRVMGILLVGETNPARRCCDRLFENHLRRHAVLWEHIVNTAHAFFDGPDVTFTSGTCLPLTINSRKSAGVYGHYKENQIPIIQEGGD